MKTATIKGVETPFDLTGSSANSYDTERYCLEYLGEGTIKTNCNGEEVTGRLKQVSTHFWRYREKSA